MSREITQRELRNESGEIMRKLDEGETFIVTRNGVPVGELSPCAATASSPQKPRSPSSGRQPPVDADRFRTDLDLVASQDLSPRA